MALSRMIHNGHSVPGFSFAEFSAIEDVLGENEATSCYH